MEETELSKVMKALLQRFDAFEKRFDQIEEDVKITKDITSEMIQIMDKSIIFETAISEESRAHLLVLQLTARDKLPLPVKTKQDFIKSAQQQLFESLAQAQNGDFNNDDAQLVSHALQVGAGVTLQIQENEYNTNFMTNVREIEEPSFKPAENAESSKDNLEAVEVEPVESGGEGNPLKTTTQVLEEDAQETNKENQNVEDFNADDDSLLADFTNDCTIVPSRRKTVKFSVPFFEDGSNFLASTPRVAAQQQGTKRIKRASIDLSRRPQSLNLSQTDRQSVIEHLQALDDDTEAKTEDDEATIIDRQYEQQLQNDLSTSKKQLSTRMVTLPSFLVAGTPEFEQREQARNESWNKSMEANKSQTTSSSFNSSRVITSEPNAAPDMDKNKKKKKPTRKPTPRLSTTLGGFGIGSEEEQKSTSMPGRRAKRRKVDTFADQSTMQGGTTTMTTLNNTNMLPIRRSERLRNRQVAPSYEH